MDSVGQWTFYILGLVTASVLILALLAVIIRFLITRLRRPKRDLKSPYSINSMEMYGKIPYILSVEDEFDSYSQIVTTYTGIAEQAIEDGNFDMARDALANAGAALNLYMASLDDV